MKSILKRNFLNCWYQHWVINRISMQGDRFPLAPDNKYYLLQKNPASQILNLLQYSRVWQCRVSKKGIAKANPFHVLYRACFCGYHFVAVYLQQFPKA